MLALALLGLASPAKAKDKTLPPRLRLAKGGALPDPEHVSLERERRRRRADTPDSGLNFVMPSEARSYLYSRASDKNPFRKKLRADPAMYWLHPNMYKSLAHPGHGDPAVWMGLRTPEATGSSARAVRSMLNTRTKLPYWATQDAKES